MKEIHILGVLCLMLLLVIIAFPFAKAFYMGIPLPVYSEYLSVQGVFNCERNDASCGILKCSDNVSNKFFYRVFGEYEFGKGSQVFLTENGNRICNFTWNIDMRDDYRGPPAECPKSNSCVSIINN